MRRSILIAGGTGFLGRGLLRFLRQINSASTTERFSVCVISRSPSRFLEKHPEFSSESWLTVIEGNILDRESLPHNENFDYVIHAAADSAPNGDFSDDTRFAQIIVGTKNILALCRACGVKRLLFISSGAVYGLQPRDVMFISEDVTNCPDPLVMGSAYGIAKKAAEHMCVLASHGSNLDVVIARCFSFVGVGLPFNEHYAIGNFVRDAVLGGPVRVRGDGSAVRSYLDVDDLAHWLMVLLERGKSGSAYNVGSDRAVSIRDLAFLVRDLVSPAGAVEIQNSLVGARTSSIYVPSIRLAEAELGLSVKTPLETAIIGYARWVRDFVS
jgi:UDP-glucuronate decarboxylase